MLHGVVLVKQFGYSSSSFSNFEETDTDQPTPKEHIPRMAASWHNDIAKEQRIKAARA